MNKKIENSIPVVIIYTDGSCSGNPGKGGWGALLIYEGKNKSKEKEISGGELETTNNRMELKAVIEALKLLNRSCNVKLHSDSSYIINAFNQNWLNNWKKNNWKTSKNKSVLNIDLWKELDELSRKHNIKWIKVKGHSNNINNNRVDAIARRETELIN